MRTEILLPPYHEDRHKRDVSHGIEGWMLPRKIKGIFVLYYTSQKLMLLRTTSWDLTYLIDSFSHFFNIKSSSNRLIFKYYVYRHLTPSCLGCIHGKGKRVPWFCFSCVLLIRYLKCNSNGWIQVSINNWNMKLI